MDIIVFNEILLIFELDLMDIINIWIGFKEHIINIWIGFNGYY
jgi:hypothetical protein